MSQDFYLRYYVGHKGKFGHEFLEFEFRPDGVLFTICLFVVVYVTVVLGKLRYANNSNYKNDTMIRKEVCRYNWWASSRMIYCRYMLTQL